MIKQQPKLFKTTPQSHLSLPFIMPKKRQPPKDLAIFYGEIKGFTQVSKKHTLKDVRASILEEFDDDMLPGDDAFCFHINDFRISRKQEDRKLAWDIVENEQVLSLHPKTATAAPKPQVEDILEDANESDKQGPHDEDLPLTFSSRVTEEIQPIITPKVHTRPAPPAARADTCSTRPTASKKRPLETQNLAIGNNTSDMSDPSEEPQEQSSVKNQQSEAIRAEMLVEKHVSQDARPRKKKNMAIGNHSRDFLSRLEEPQESMSQVQETPAKIPAVQDAIPDFALVSAVCTMFACNPKENGQERRYFRLKATAGSLGINLSTIKFSSNDKIGSTDAFVSHVSSGGPLDGIVAVGDAIVSVNGDDVRRYILSKVKHILMTCETSTGPCRMLTFMKREPECAPKESEETHKRIRNEKLVQPPEHFNNATSPSVSTFTDDSTDDDDADSSEDGGASRQTTSTQESKTLSPARHSEDGADAEPHHNAISSRKLWAVGISSPSQVAAAVKEKFEAMIAAEIQLQTAAFASAVPPARASSTERVHNQNNGNTITSESESQEDRGERGSSVVPTTKKGRKKKQPTGVYSLYAPPDSKLGILLYNLQTRRGVGVSEVLADSVWVGKVAAGHRITAVDGEDVSNMRVSELVEHLKGRLPGKTFTFSCR
jgi:hypothetical protein